MNTKKLLLEICNRWELGLDRRSKELPESSRVPPGFSELNATISHVKQYLSGEFSYLSPSSRGRSLVFDLSTADFKNLNNNEIADQFGCSAPTVAKWRVRHGLPTTKMQRLIDWSKVDWSKNNQVLAAELGVGIGNVNKYRKMAGAPQVGKCGHSGRKISKEMIDAIDWTQKRDIDLSMEWGVSRERVRQLRLENKKPQCVHHWLSAPMIALTDAIESHRSELAGKDLPQITEIILPTLGMVKRQSLVKALKRLGVQYNERRTRKIKKYPLDEINWQLPNSILTIIYNAPKNVIASARSLDCKRKAKYHAGGKFSKFWLKDGFNEALNSEFATAAKHGFVVQREVVARYIEAKKPRTHNGSAAMSESGIFTKNGFRESLPRCAGQPASGRSVQTRRL